MSEIKVNKISPRSGTTVTLGDSGDTFTIPSGATINNQGTATNFGATGSASWDTTKITADPGPAVAGVGYFTDTSGSAFNVTLPASPSAGAVIAVADYANNWGTNAVTLLRNGSNIEGAASDFICNQSGAAITFVYVDATKGWVATDTGNSNDAFGETFITATGGTITECGNCKIHTFTGPGTFTVSQVAASAANNVVSYIVVAGGGGGGGQEGSGGGGAGGFREAKSPSTPYAASPLDGYPSAPNRITVTATGFPIAVGGGGTGGTVGSTPQRGITGSNSTFSTIIAAGGGGGGTHPTPACGPGGNGGSGGGGGARFNFAGGTGNTPPVTPSQGNNGGNSAPSPTPSTIDAGGGGGGATAVGANAADNQGAAGGAGATTSINGSPVAYAGGGGGGIDPSSPGPAGAGGAGGGGAGGPSGSTGTSGSTNKGGGGGGSGISSPGVKGGGGGSGIVIIRYKFQ